MESKVFRRKIDFYNFINSLTDNFDLRKSLIANNYSFVTADGKHVNSMHFRHFIANLNSVLGLSFDEKFSREKPAGYVIVLKDGVDPEKESDKAVTEKDEEIAKKDIVIEDDFIDKAKSLYNEDSKKESKDKLAALASEKGIDLDKRQTFESMIEQLENSIKK